MIDHGVNFIPTDDDGVDKDGDKDSETESEC